MTKTFALATACLLALPAVAAAEVKQGDHFAELDAKTATGKKFRLKDMTGKWVLYSFNASWCGPCKKELPAWDAIAPKLGGKVLFVAVNINTEAQEGQEFIESLKLRHMLPVYLPDENCPAMKAYDLDRMPSTYVIDPQGVVRIVEHGYNKGDESKLLARLQELTK